VLCLRLDVQRGGNFVIQQNLVVFTRFPESGKAKTRLIPAMGPERAAGLAREMTQHTLAWARELAESFPVSVEVRFDGGDAERMAIAFGDGIPYRPQGEGDLGCRMEHAFQEAFSEGSHRAVLIGTDCPEITPELILESLEQLATCDLVLGPASDGGYYLIGLRASAPQLFTEIAWGSERVLEQTLRRADQLSLNVSLLKTLSDVDCPEDLSVWHRVRQSLSAPSTTRISAVIPTFNEAANLPQTLRSLRDAENLEIIVVDGGSNDGTLDIAEREGCRVLRSMPGRAVQMNAGAGVASGSVLLFLHADTRLAPGFCPALRAALQEPGVVGGAFRLRIDAPGWPLRIIEQAAHVRSRALKMPYGDQGIFVRKETFQELGGFAMLPIMEDFEFIQRLRHRGRIRIVPLPASTSGRRWQQFGPWRTTWINQKIIVGYCLGISPDRLAQWYRKGQSDGK
jgi:rSAM/selenodomain-associated transferase 2/rSAM/selenodomain-associated transferase 1